MQVGAAPTPAVLLRGCDRLARTLRRGTANRFRVSTMPTQVPSAPTAAANEKVSRPAGPEEVQNLAALLPIGAELKARIRILVVDDEHTLRESCATVLRQEGYDVTVCGRGQDALDLLKRRGFDLVLVDLYMSQVDGDRKSVV